MADRITGKMPATRKETAVKMLPPLDINLLIQEIVAVSKEEKSVAEAAKELAKPYIPFAKVYAKSQAQKLIENGLEKYGSEKLSGKEFSKKLVNTAEKTGTAVALYMNHSITEEELVKRIGGSGIQDVTRQVLEALGIHEKAGVEKPGEILKLAPQVVAYTASMAAFKELKKHWMIFRWRRNRENR